MPSSDQQSHVPTNTSDTASHTGKRVLAILIWPLFFLSMLLCSALLSWHLLAQVNFAFPQFYQHLNIQQHIEKFGPQNYYRKHFADTSTEQHHMLFGEIVDSIQNQGKGLSDITYVARQQTQTLLRKPEVVHLQDVSNLITVFYNAGIPALIIVILGVVLCRRRWLTWPKTGHVIIALGTIALGIGALFALIGFKDIFYWLHVQIFPKDHQWFFFYQESLMTTLMKAPDVFAYIGGLLGIVTVIVFGIGLWLARILMNNKL